MSAFKGLTQELCEKAFELVQPAIALAMMSGTVKRSHGVLVVLDPKIPSAPGDTLDLGGRFVDEVVLFTHDLDDGKEWEHSYDLIALAKAYASWKTGLPSSRIQHEAPYLLGHNMTKFGGSAVDEGGLVVAFSGVEEWFDQMFSEMMLAAIKGVCLHEMYKPDGLMASAGEFITK